MRSLFNLQKSSTKQKANGKVRVAIASDYPEVMEAFAEALAEFGKGTKKARR